MTSKEDTLRKRLYAFHEKDCDISKKFTVNHFEAEIFPSSTLFDILKREEDGILPERQSGRSRPCKTYQKAQ
jgi:hypothetical protein